MKTRLIILVVAFSFLATENLYAQSGNVLTLKQCIDKAIANNADVQQKKLLLEESGVQVKQAKNNALPDLFANLNHGINQGRSIDPFTNGYSNQSFTYGNYNLSSGIVLFNGGQNRNTIKQNELDYQANSSDVNQTKDNVTLNVILAYLQILNNKDLLIQANAQAAVTRKQVDRLAILNNVGAVAPATFYDLKGQLANDELTIINTQNALDEAKLTLCQLMNIPFDKTIDVESIPMGQADNYTVTDPQEIYALASTTLPVIKSAELRRQSAEKGLQIARGNRYPLVSFGGSINTNYSNAAALDVLVSTTEVESGDFVKYNGSKLPVMTQRSTFNNQKISYINQFNNNYNTAIYLNVRIPILNGFRAKNRIASAKILVKTADINEQTAKTQLNQLIEQAYFNQQAAGAKMKTLETQVADFTESFRTAEVRFNAGAITQVDYLIAKNNVDKSQTNLIITRYDYIFRGKILDYYRGNLLVQ